MIQLDLLSLGLACPLGLHAIEALAALKTNLRSIYRLEDGETLEREAGEVVRASRLLELDAGLARSARVSFYAQRALQQAVAPFGVHVRGAPLYLATPEPRDAAGFELGGLFGELGAGLGSMQVFPHGRAGMFAALARARAELETGRHPFAIVGGADSLADPRSLLRLAREGRLLGDANPDGMIPGEGAAFVVLARDGMGLPGQTPLARLGPASSGLEPQPIGGADPSTSEAAGLTHALTGLRQLHPRRVDLVHSAQTAQSYWARELSLAATRNAALMPAPMQLRRRSEALGELGAAAGAIALAAAALEFHPLVPGRASAPSLPHRALVYACADAGQVGATLVFARPLHMLP